jgi:hypothetical protein
VEKNWSWWIMPIIPAIMGIVLQTCLGKKRDRILKIAKAKRAGGVA